MRSSHFLPFLLSLLVVLLLLAVSSTLSASASTLSDVEEDAEFEEWLQEFLNADDEGLFVFFFFGSHPSLHHAR